MLPQMSETERTALDAGTVWWDGALFSGSLPPNGTVNVGFEVITPAIMRQIVGSSGVNISTQKLKAEVLAQVTIKGELGGDSIESKPFFYPISVCTDCVVVNIGQCPESMSANSTFLARASSGTSPAAIHSRASAGVNSGQTSNTGTS